MRHLLFALCLLSLSVDAATLRYVRQGATGAQTGLNWTDAYTSLPTTLIRDSIYYVADGTYPGYSANTPNNGTQWIVIKKATVAEHGTEIGWDNSYGDGNAFLGTVSPRTDYWEWSGATRNESSWNTASAYGFRFALNYLQYAFVSSDYVCDGCPSNPDIDPDNWVIKYISFEHPGYRIDDEIQAINVIYGVKSDWKVQKCNFYWIGVWICYRTPNWLLEDCFVGPTTGKETIRNYFGSDDVTIRNNIFVDCGNHSRHGAQGATQPQTAIIGFWDNNGGLHRWKIHGNVFHETGNYAIGYTQAAIKIGDDGYPACNDHQIFNNVFSGLGTGRKNAEGNLAYGYPIIRFRGTGNVAHNNVWVGSPVPYTGGPFPPYDFNGNISGASSAQNNWVEPASTSGPLVANGTNTRVGTADPFVNRATLNFTPKDPSIVSNPDIVNNGVNPGAGFNAADPLGNTRGGDGTWDIGVYEYNGSPVAPTVNSSTNAVATNTVAFSYTISSGASSFGISNAPSGMSINASLGLISWTPNTNAAQYVVGLLATNSAGHAHTNLYIQLYNPPAPSIEPILNVLPLNGTNWGLISTNLAALVTKTFTVSNAGPDTTTLNFTSIVAAPFFITGSVSNGLLVANASTNVMVGVRPTAIGQRDVPIRWVATNGLPLTNILHVDAHGIHPTNAWFPAIHGLVFTNQPLANWNTNSGYLQYPGNSDTAFNGAKAVYGFVLSEARQFRLKMECWPGYVNANGLFVGVNTDPGTLQTPLVQNYIYDVAPLYEGIESDQAAWNAGTLKFYVHIRGNGQPVLPGPNYAPEFTNAIFNGVVGTNFIYLYNREGEGDIYIRQLLVETIGTLPSTPPGVPSNPQPANGLGNRSPTNIVLSWQMGDGAVSNDVYWTLDPMQFNLLSSQSASTFELFLEQIHFSTTNYWQIVNWNEFGRSTGAVWHYVTREAPPIPEPATVGPLRRPPRNATRLVSPVIGP